MAMRMNTLRVAEPFLLEVSHAKSAPTADRNNAT
jgi:hypothetical protein